MENCKFAGCKDEAIAFSEYCWEHTAKKDEYVADMLSEIKKGNSLGNMNFTKVALRNLDLSKSVFEGSNLTRVDFSGSNLFDANLNNAELLGANLANADLTSATLQGADLTKANLFGARLWHANLKSANLVEANLAHCDFWNANLFDIKLWHTDLSNVLSLGRQNFAFKINPLITIYRINEKGILSSEEAYRSLKSHFLSKGKYNDASWASYKEKRMERQLLKKKKDPAYLPSLLMDILCGYGEKPYKIITSSFMAILGYACLYLFLDAVKNAELGTYRLNLIDYIYYSTITFTTVGYGDFIPKSVALFRFLAATEAFTGAFMIGLFVFTLARKYSGR